MRLFRLFTEDIDYDVREEVEEDEQEDEQEEDDVDGLFRLYTHYPKIVDVGVGRLVFPLRSHTLYFVSENDHILLAEMSSRELAYAGVDGLMFEGIRKGKLIIEPITHVQNPYVYQRWFLAFDLNSAGPPEEYDLDRKDQDYHLQVHRLYTDTPRLWR